jgi:hypothetical protein
MSKKTPSAPSGSVAVSLPIGTDAQVEDLAFRSMCLTLTPLRFDAFQASRNAL